MKHTIRKSLISLIVHHFFIQEPFEETSTLQIKLQEQSQEWSWVQSGFGGNNGQHQF